MINKIKAILFSIRFWIITLTAVTGFLTLVQAHGFQMIDFLGVITAWLGTVAGVGTIDKFSETK